MIGGGSNIVWRDEGFPGLIMVNKIIRFEEQVEDEENYYITVGAGENWDSVVARTTEKGMSGIEALSLIPGTAGATPVQNVGAYGQEIANVLVSVEAYDTEAKQFVNVPAFDCGFGYHALAVSRLLTGAGSLLRLLPCIFAMATPCHRITQRLKLTCRSIP